MPGKAPLRRILISRIIPLFAISIAILLAASTAFASLRIFSEIKGKNLAIADEAAFLIDAILDDGARDLSRIARSIDRSLAARGGLEGRGPGERELERALLSDIAREGRFQSLRIIGADGVVRLAYPDDGTEGFSMTGMPSLQATEGRPFHGSVFLSQAGRPALPIAARSGPIVAAGELSLDWLDEFVRTMDFGRSGNAALADADGTFIAHTDRSLVERRVSAATLDILRIVREEGRGAALYDSGNGLRIGAGARIADWGWFLIVSESFSEAFSPILELALILLAGLTMALLALLLFFRSFIDRTLAPLGALVDGARNLAAGDFKALDSIEADFSEMEILISEFDAMAGSIAERESQLRSSKAATEASLAEKEVLLREVHHRVKNNMQVISSMISLQRTKIDDPRVELLFSDTDQRIRSMALVHESLYGSSNLESIDLLAYIGELLRSVGHSAGVSWEFEGDSAPLSLDRAVPCALAVNELAMNAVKHASKRGRGHFKVRISRTDGEIAIGVEDDGPGFREEAPAERATGIGLVLVKALASQLKGRLEWSDRPEGGARFLLVFPEEPPGTAPRAAIQ